MEIQRFPSRVLEEAVNELSKLPGVGKKTALRLVLFLLKQEKEQIKGFSKAFLNLAEEICYCKVCHNISDKEVCEICASPSRDKQMICVVENVKDVLTIESTHQFSGVYHVLGGIISPIDGIAPDHIEIASLLERTSTQEVTEVILALPTTMEGDTTNFYIYRKLEKSAIKLTTLARGVAIGDELEYTDEITLGRSIANRLLFKNTIL